MARTTSLAVQELLRNGTEGGDYDDENSPPLDPFIITASSIVDDLVTAISDQGLTALSVAKKEIIERWLAAHCYVQSDRIMHEQKVGRSEGRNRGPQHPYLDVAKTLDPTGLLEEVMEGSEVARGFWLGRHESDQTDYIDRNW